MRRNSIFLEVKEDYKVNGVGVRKGLNYSN